MKSCLFQEKLALTQGSLQSTTATIILMMNCGETPFTNLRKSLGERKS